MAVTDAYRCECPACGVPCELWPTHGHQGYRLTFQGRSHAGECPELVPAHEHLRGRHWIYRPRRAPVLRLEATA